MMKHSDNQGGEEQVMSEFEKEMRALKCIFRFGSISDIAKVANVERKTIYNWFKNPSSANPFGLMMIAREYRLNLASLFRMCNLKVEMMDQAMALRDEGLRQAPIIPHPLMLTAGSQDKEPKAPPEGPGGSLEEILLAAYRKLLEVNPEAAVDVVKHSMDLLGNSRDEASELIVVNGDGGITITGQKKTTGEPES